MSDSCLELLVKDQLKAQPEEDLLEHEPLQ